MSSVPILPVYQRTISNGVSKFFPNKSCRFKEKHLIVTVLTIIILGSFGTMFFMPDIREIQVARVYDQLKNSAPELLFPPPPRLENSKLGHENSEHLHLRDDREKLRVMIERDADLRVLESPPLNIQKTTTQKIVINNNISTNGFPVIRGGEDKDLQARERRETVKQMMKHAWDGYVKYAWGQNELRPITKTGHHGSIFGSAHLGATIMDAMDTLYIMGLDEEFNKGKEWIIQELNMEKIISSISVFEVNIRFVGGLLTCFALTGDVIFRDKAKEIADKLLPAFNTQTGIPYALVNFKTGRSQNYGWASTSSLLSEYGTLYLEFYYLSEITGDPIYRQKVDHILEFLDDKDKPNGLYPNYINPHTGKWGINHVSIGSLGDSFYEYLLKTFLQSNKKNIRPKKMFEETINAMLDKMLFTSSSGLVHFSELRNGKPEHKMEHLACFSGGMLGLASRTLNSTMSKKYMQTAKDVTYTCRQSYDKSKVKLGPESFRFTDTLDATADRSAEIVYILRPEVLESYFYMWRLTKDQKYRDWAWDMVQALEKHCKVPTGGYTGLKNVYSENPAKDDVMQSFFLAETLKYLYLIFSDDSLISLDEWVLNSEAHPLPIKDVNPYFRGL